MHCALLWDKPIYVWQYCEDIQANEEDKWIANTLEVNDVGPEREERVIHQLIKDSPELQSLRAKLQIAEISRQRHQQVYISPWILMLITTRVDSEICKKFPVAWETYHWIRRSCAKCYFPQGYGATYSWGIKKRTRAAAAEANITGIHMLIFHFKVSFFPILRWYSLNHFLFC